MINPIIENLNITDKYAAFEANNKTNLIECISILVPHDFNKMSRYLNPKINQKYSHVLKINEVNSVIDSCVKIKLLSDLQKNLLVNSNLNKKSVKI